MHVSSRLCVTFHTEGDVLSLLLSSGVQCNLWIIVNCISLSARIISKLFKVHIMPVLVHEAFFYIVNKAQYVVCTY